MIALPSRAPNGHGIVSDHKAQSAVWGLLAILVLVLISGGLVDLYRLYAARNWAYSVAQEAALAGASKGRDWGSLLSDGGLALDETTAIQEAQTVIVSAMQARGVSGYNASIQVLPEASGGTINGFPPAPARLGAELDQWTSDEPAVGIYLVVPVDWTILDLFAIDEKSVRVFASAGVAQ